MTSLHLHACFECPDIKYTPGHQHSANSAMIVKPHEAYHATYIILQPLKILFVRAWGNSHLCFLHYPLIHLLMITLHVLQCVINMIHTLHSVEHGNSIVHFLDPALSHKIIVCGRSYIKKDFSLICIESIKTVAVSYSSIRSPLHTIYTISIYI